MSTDVAAASNAESGAGPRDMVAETIRDLERVNKELLVRVKELELARVGDVEQNEDNLPEHTEPSAQSSSIIAIVKDLHGEIDAAHELRDALEVDLGATQKKLSEEQAACGELEGRVNLLEDKAALSDQLRDDISFVEEERNRTARRLAGASSKLEQITAERDSLAEQKAIHETHIKELQGEKIGLKAQVLNLKEKVAEMDRLRLEIAEAGQSRQLLEEKVLAAKSKLEANETARHALKLDAATTRERVCSLNEQIEELRDKLAAVQAEVTALRTQLDEQEAENANLHEVHGRKEREIKTLSVQNDDMREQLALGNKALQDIRTAAALTTDRIRKRYGKSPDGQSHHA